MAGWSAALRPTWHGHMAPALGAAFAACATGRPGPVSSASRASTFANVYRQSLYRVNMTLNTVGWGTCNEAVAGIQEAVRKFAYAPV
jgi:hypothetical protein